jgi:hypothetical protein
VELGFTIGGNSSRLAISQKVRIALRGHMAALATRIAFFRALLDVLGSLSSTIVAVDPLHGRDLGHSGQGFEMAEAGCECQRCRR